MGYTQAGLSSQTSALIEIDEKLVHFGTGQYVYEASPDSDLNRIIPFLSSSDLGSLVNWVHNIEIDYQQSMDQVIGECGCNYDILSMNNM